MTCTYPDLAASTGYKKGCRCSRCRANVTAARRRQRAGNAAPVALGKRDAIIGWNALEPGPLVRLCARAGLTPHTSADSPAIRRAIDRYGPQVTAVPHRLRTAIDRGWIGEKLVDETCVWLGSHPAAIYGNAWYALVCQDATPDELADAGLTHPNDRNIA